MISSLPSNATTSIRLSYNRFATLIFQNPIRFRPAVALVAAQAHKDAIHVGAEDFVRADKRFAFVFTHHDYPCQRMTSRTHAATRFLSTTDNPDRFNW